MSFILSSFDEDKQRGKEKLALTNLLLFTAVPPLP